MDEPHPSTTTVPSADSSTLPTSPTSPTSPTHNAHNASPRPPNPTLLKQLRFLLARSLAATDHNLLRLSKLLSTPTGIDVLLCTTSYTLTLVRALLSRVLEKRLAAAALAAKTNALLPPSTTLLAQSIASSKALAGTIADYRIFVRMWGMLGIYTWARGVYLAPLPADASRKDAVQRQITWAAIATSVGFQVLENGAYLSSKGVLTGAAWAGDAGKSRETAWWVWSSRFWAAYVGCELLCLGVARWWPSSEAVVDDTDGEKEGKIRREREAAEKREENWVWWKDLTSNIAYAPMTLHWSVEEGLLSDAVVGACGVVAGGAMLADAWRKTA
jgi:hypothetical protein